MTQNSSDARRPDSPSPQRLAATIARPIVDIERDIDYWEGRAQYLSGALDHAIAMRDSLLHEAGDRRG